MEELNQIFSTELFFAFIESVFVQVRFLRLVTDEYELLTKNWSPMPDFLSFSLFIANLNRIKHRYKKYSLFTN